VSSSYAVVCIATSEYLRYEPQLTCCDVHQSHGAEIDSLDEFGRRHDAAVPPRCVRSEPELASLTPEATESSMAREMDDGDVTRRVAYSGQRGVGAQEHPTVARCVLCRDQLSFAPCARERVRCTDERVRHNEDAVVCVGRLPPVEEPLQDGRTEHLRET
jgi:hypothetical protein